MNKFILFTKIIAISFIIASFNQSPANSNTPFKNITINKNFRTISPVKFKNLKNEEISLANFKGNLILLNFWATWCLPCKEEMPSLDNLMRNKKFNNLKIFPVNLENVKKEKLQEFFYKLNIKNLEIFVDPDLNLVKEFKLRGLPTTIIINKKGQEFAKIIGSVDFTDEKFVNWLINYN